MRPFDKHFTKAKIIDTCIKMGFLPMTGNAANDPKVGYELGEGGAPEGASQRLVLLEEEYKECREALENLGYNSGILDLEPRRVMEEETFTGDKEAQIKDMLDNNKMSKAGTLFKSGNIVITSQVVVEAAKRANKKEKERKKAIAEKKKKASEDTNFGSIRWWQWWKNGGKDSKGRPRQAAEYNSNSNPKLPKNAATAIVKVLLPRIVPDGNMKDYNSMKKCVA